MQTIFVYGTLRPTLRTKYGFYKHSHLPLGEKVGEGSICAKLYPLGGRVPGVVLMERRINSPRVKGELVRFTEDEMKAIDNLEAGYRKSKVVVDVAGGLTVDALVYEIPQDHVDGIESVKSGDWDDYLKELYRA